MAMQTQNKEEPLAVKVQCKHCQAVQLYTGQIKCKVCNKQGSLQLIRREDAVR